MIVPKSSEEIAEEVKDTVSSKTGLNTLQEGSIVRAIIDSFSEEMSDLYETLSTVQKQSYLSTSQGNYVDLISELLNVKRNTYETDDSMKERTSEAVFVTAGGNRLAIENAIESIDEVSDYEIKEYTNGPGSFTVFVYPQIDGLNELALTTKVKEAVSNVISDGTYFEVRVPEGVIVDLNIILSFKPNASELEQRELKNRSRVAVIRYLNELKKDEVLVINEIVQRVMEVSDKILDMGISNYSLNGKSQIPVNTFPKSNQEFRPGNITVG